MIGFAVLEVFPIAVWRWISMFVQMHTEQRGEKYNIR